VHGEGVDGRGIPVDLDIEDADDLTVAFGDEFDAAGGGRLGDLDVVLVVGGEEAEQAALQPARLVGTASTGRRRWWRVSTTTRSSS
jgi:hypothetical protein